MFLNQCICFEVPKLACKYTGSKSRAAKHGRGVLPSFVYVLGFILASLPISYCQSQPGKATLVPYWNKTKITVCTSPYTPMVFCDAEQDQSKYTGFEIEFFRNVAQELNWKPEIYDLKCMEWSEMEDDLMAGGTFGNGTCDMAVAGYSAIPELVDAGYIFTWPSTQVGKIIMVKATQEQPGMWFFLSAISAKVWIIMIITAVITGLIVWLCEVGSEALNRDTRWMSNVMWDTMGRAVEMRDYRLSSTAANFVALMWSFLVFIIMSMYTANLTANITTTQLTSQIHSLSDLPGKAVGSWDAFVEPLKKYNIMATPFPWENLQDEDAMIEQLRVGNIQALIMESPTMYVHDATSCDTVLIEPVFDAADIAVVFPPGFDDEELLKAYNDAVITVLANGDAETLTARFIKVPQAPCKTGAVTQDTQKVQWGQVSGLWVMLAASLGLALILIGYKWVPRWISKSEKYSRVFPWCAALTKPNERLILVHDRMQRIGSGQVGNVKRTPKSDEPRSPLSFEDHVTWTDHYLGAPAGYLDASRDAPQTVNNRNIDNALLEQLARLTEQVAALQTRIDGGASVRPHAPMRYPSANVHSAPGGQ